MGYPIYVVNKSARTNTVTVGEKDDLQATGCTATEANWLMDEPTHHDWIPCAAKIRYNATPVPARVRIADRDIPTDGGLEVQFDEPQFAVAPGQAVVCYDNETVMCGGWIQWAV